MNNDTQKLIIEKNSILTKDLIKEEQKNNDLEFMNSDELIVISKAIIEKGELIHQ